MADDPGTFGSGLSFNDGGGAGAGPGVGGADVPPPMSLAPPAPAAPPATPAAAPKAGFGSGLTFGAPKYTAPDPNMSALDQSADVLQQRIKRANDIASNPMLQFFNPEGVQKARDFAPQAAEKLQQIRVQQAGIMAGKQQAQTLGLAPGEVPDEATQADRVAVAQAKALKGNLIAWKGLAAVQPEAAAAIQDQVHEAVAGHIGKAQYAFDSLAGMQNQGQYAAKINQLRTDGTLTDLEALGVKIPASIDEFNAAKGREGQALREARQASENLKAKLEERANGQPMEEKEQKTYAGRLTTESGQEISNGTWSRINGKRVFTVNGMGDVNDLGKKYTFASPEQRKAFHEDVKAAVPEKEIEKARDFGRIRTLATTDEKGNFIPAEGAVGKDGKRMYLNTNPNIQQGIAEGLASMLRGGSGGATSGLLNIETSKRGYVQAALDKIITNYGGAINTLTGEQVKPYLSELTQDQMRSVLDGLHAYSGKSVSDRTTAIARRAGELGLDASALGFGKGEIGGIDAAVEQGRQSTIERFKARARATSGGDGGIYLDNPPPVLVTDPDHPPGSVPPVPPPVSASPGSSVPPGAAVPPAGAPSGGPGSPGPAGGSGAQPPAAPQSPQPGVAPTTPPGPAGGGPTPAAPQPVMIGGQTVNVPTPPGASPGFVPALQRIETGKKKDPWTAETGKGPDGKQLSSASGAYQMLDAVWNENKPAGATAMRAKDATPEQQTAAFANLTAKNGAALTKAGLPVNDTSLYIAHNLGATGAQGLLSADPNADARTVAGERAARNNPTFFKGRPTVATVLQRYKTEMEKTPDDSGPQPKPGAGGATAEAPGIMTRISRMLSQGVPGDGAAKDKAVADVGNAAVEHAPAIGATAGAIVAGPAGGAAGGYAGSAARSYMQGKPQNQLENAKEGLLGGILGVAGETRPLLTAAGRVVGGAAIEGGATAAEGGSTADIADAAVKGGAYMLGGEALGRFISAAGPAVHKVLSNYAGKSQAEVSAQAGKLVEARATLASEQPKLPGEAGGPNPKYEAAQKAEAEATQYLKDHNLKPDDMAYAYEQVKGGVSAGEAMTMRRANSEKGEVGAGYNQLREDVAGAKPGEKNIKPNIQVPDGPLSTIRTPENPTGKVPEAFRADAEHAEMLVKAPAKDWGAKWGQLQDAGSELIKKRMDFLTAGDKTSAAAMNDIFQGVRNQQKAVANRLFGEKQGAEVIAHLENLDKRYAKVMNATAGMNYKKMGEIIQGGNTPERRELEANFKEFAKDDPSAIRAFNAMKAGAKGRLGEEAKLMVPVIAGEVAAHASGIPTLGVISAAIGGHRLVNVLREYMNAKLLGKPVTFKDFAVDAVKNYQHGPLNAAGQAAQRAVAM